mgnify:CR=1 FL=1
MHNNGFRILAVTYIRFSEVNGSSIRPNHNQWLEIIQLQEIRYCNSIPFQVKSNCNDLLFWLSQLHLQLLFAITFNPKILDRPHKEKINPVWG